MTYGNSVSVPGHAFGEVGFEENFVIHGVTLQLWLALVWSFTQVASRELIAIGWRRGQETGEVFCGTTR